jgi:hypothetical protein
MADILVLRQQLNVLRGKSPKRHAFSNFDRLIFAGLYHIAPRVLNALAIMEPETVVRWHRTGRRLFSLSQLSAFSDISALRTRTGS